MYLSNFLKNNKTMRKNYNNNILFVFFIVSSYTFGQSPSKEVIVNEGLLSVSEEGILSTTHDFSNQKTGTVKTDGSTYYYSNFHNDNLYYHDDKKSTAKAVFTRFNSDKGKQIISGKEPSFFYDVILDNAEENIAFDLKNEINIKGAVDFKDGIIKVDSLVGGLTFHHGARAINPNDNSHADGFVEKIGNEEFTYPKGNKGFYRYAHITAPELIKDTYHGKYMLDDKIFLKEHNTKSGVIELVNNREYWIIEEGKANKEHNIMLTLSWDERTTPKELLYNPTKDLHILRWDIDQKMWVDEGGVANLDTKEVTTVSAVKGFGYFTLGTVKTNLLLDGDVVIYNLVTPNDDGKNDYFLIDNINYFPNNKVEIYNRWGVKVYETTNYDSKGNVFRGYSEGRVTLNKKEKLPTGTYFYIVTYEYVNAQGSRMIKKSGYLHLENN